MLRGHYLGIPGGGRSEVAQHRRGLLDFKLQVAAGPIHLAADGWTKTRDQRLSAQLQGRGPHVQEPMRWHAC